MIYTLRSVPVNFVAVLMCGKRKLFIAFERRKVKRKYYQKTKKRKNLAESIIEVCALIAVMTYLFLITIL